ncbi:fluoroquinolone resistance protein [Photobacterium jeanii]|uniref:Fluoroquinolone resistance protein n=1 Tax=Photobacterium jeanii TaxID=858640 RepID=A0A178KMB5_9GAMM|nr:Qnr family pentapeptide repeat protein [Photobacterium jeanii]OAN18145.1 fluoroquinolone resistance protein [Photobacterium jeanii]PST92179.1 Qnr family quinolone resistance pentapeptide repeat protein [Photobacterium jeanii]
MHAKNQTFHQASFAQQDLQDAKFEDCHFYECDFNRANLQDAQFVNCKFIEPNGVQGCQFDYANLRDASFKQCQLAMANFSGANCFGAEFRQCDLKGANFNKTSFVNQISHSSYFCSAYITGCNLSYANLEDQRLEKCDLFENRWTGASLFGASFKGSDLSRSEFSEDCWGQFNIEGCDLSHSELYGLDPRRVNLHGVKICDWQQEQLLNTLGLIVVPD